VKLDLDFWSPDEWRINDKQNLQSSSFKKLSKEEIAELESSLEYTYKYISVTYDHLIAQGVAREQARAILPVGTYTEFYWTVNLRSLFNFIRLRTAEDAQEEMRDYATVIHDIAKENATWCFEAFESEPL
jgi:thymidylate synthase (FAD)